MQTPRFQELLEATSRSFALGIRSLEPESREWIQAAYLLCRVFDTYEDATGTPATRRTNLLLYASDLLETLPETERLTTLLASWDRRHSETLGNESERALLAEGAALWTHIGSFPFEVRKSFRRRLRPMLEGMLGEVARQRQGAAAPRSIEETDRYCYVVAGTVGELLTELFSQSQALPPKPDDDVFELAVDFGKALQLVNIAKDFHSDRLEGRCYWPGVSLSGNIAPSFEALEASFRLIEQRFQHSRERAWSYVDRINKARRPDVYRFCVFPLRMAEETMELGAHDLSWLAEGGSFKLSRVQTLALLAETGLGV